MLNYWVRFVEPLTPCPPSSSAALHSPLDTIVEMYKSMTFTLDTCEPEAEDPPSTTVLESVSSKVNSLLMDKIELSVRLLNQPDNLVRITFY